MSSLTYSILKNARTVAVVGLSDKPERPSYRVAEYLQTHGYTIIPVNPLIIEWKGIRSYPDLLSIPNHIDIDVVDIFRKSEEVPSIVRDVITRGGIKSIWMQEGIENKEAVALAKQNNIEVVSNVCMMKTHKSQL